MDSDQLPDVIQFLGQAAPFSALAEGVLPEIASLITIHYYPKGLHPGLLAKPQLCWLRSGAAQLKSPDGLIIDHLDTTGCFGCLLQGTPEDAEVEIIEDALLYTIVKSEVRKLAAHYPVFARFIDERGPRYLQHQTEQQTSILHTQVGDLINRKIISVSPLASVTKAAELMTRERVSSLAVVRDNRLQGIITDKDLRSRVLAANLSGDITVEAIMSSPVQTIDASAEAMDAMMQMAEQKIHHMPVMRNQSLIGMISSTDLLHLQRTSPLFLASEIDKQPDLQALISTSHRVADLFRHLLTSGVRPERIGQVLTTVADGFTRRLLVLAESVFGPPPFAWCWLVFGSHARGELTLISDQDNALLLAEEPNTEAALYFRGLAEWVCDGLNQCGLKNCPGNIMASNSSYRLSTQGWWKQMSGWIEQPSPQALLNAGIFFDWRPIAGEFGLSEALQQRFLKEAAANQLFQLNLTQNALTGKPPLGMFGRLVLERSGSGSRGIDLKKRGLAPIVDLARVYAMAGGMRCTSTIERLHTAGELNLLSSGDARNLIEAFRFLSKIRYRLHHQQLAARQLQDHTLLPHQLSTLERHQLKDCFKLVEQAQSALAIKFAGGLR